MFLSSHIGHKALRSFRTSHTERLCRSDRNSKVLQVLDPPHPEQNTHKISSSWSSYTSEKGLRFSTYKATTRRAGVFKQHDFNASLSGPALRRVADPWERVLQSSLPFFLEEFARECKRGVLQFHSDTKSGIRRPIANPAGIVMLQKQLAAALDSIDMAKADFRDYISTRQRKVSREFSPVIQRAMQPAYDMCEAESGEFPFSQA